MGEGVSVEGGGRLPSFLLLLVFESRAVGLVEHDAVLSASCYSARLGSRRAPYVEQATSYAQQHAAMSRLHSVCLPAPARLS